MCHAVVTGLTLVDLDDSISVDAGTLGVAVVGAVVISGHSGQKFLAEAWPWLHFSGLNCNLTILYDR